MHRPAERIDDVLDELRRYWLQHPDLTLAQIVLAIAERVGAEPGDLEDTEVMGALELNVHMVSPYITPGAFRTLRPSDPWSQRPPALDAHRMGTRWLATA